MELLSTENFHQNVNKITITKNVLHIWVKHNEFVQEENPLIGEDICKPSNVESIAKILTTPQQLQKWSNPI